MSLLEDIEKKRKELIIAVEKSGLSSILTLKYSQELDELLNKYDDLEVKQL